MGELIERTSTLEDQLRTVCDERDRLHAEKTALIETVRNLSKDVSKLQNLKKTLLRSLEDSTMLDEHRAAPVMNTPSPTESVTTVDPEELISRALRSAQVQFRPPPHRILHCSDCSGYLHALLFTPYQTAYTGIGS